MSSLLRKDKIGALSEGGGTITLGPSILTIGGRQYETKSNLNVAAVLSAANTRYQIYAVASAGVVSLVVSQNENSVGPTGSSAHKLVGSYCTNPDSTFAQVLSVSKKPRVQSGATSTVDQAFPATTELTRDYNGQGSDNTMDWDLSTNSFIAPVSGTYEVDGADLWNSVAWATNRYTHARPYRNSVNYGAYSGVHSQNAGTYYILFNFTFSIYLNAGDVLEMKFIHSNSVTTTAGGLSVLARCGVVLAAIDTNIEDL